MDYMAFERNLSAVPPTLLTTNGGSTGIIHVASTIGFYVKAKAIIQAPFIPPTQVEIKRVVDEHTMWVGTIGPGMAPNVDLSVYTVLAGSFMYAEEQPKATLPMESRMLASYEQEPVNAWRNIPVDGLGSHYTPTNPFPVTPFSQFFNSLTLGALGLPALIAKCAAERDYDTVISNTVNDVETLTFYLSGTPVTTILITYSSGGWGYECTIPGATSHLLLESGDGILLEDGSGDIELE